MMSDERDRADIESLLAAHGQQHLLAFWAELDASQRQQLIGQIRLAHVEQIGLRHRAARRSNDWSALARRATPPVAFRLNGASEISIDAARTAGDAALRRGEIGAILVAGGQGTRLGFAQPKGKYSIGPVSGASLFQILFEKLLAVGRRYEIPVPLYVMTSDATHAATEDYLEAQRYFGLETNCVCLFCQGVMPAVDATTGKILLSSKSSLALSPDGHGGMLAALANADCLADMQWRGIKYLFYFQVDNPLVEMCDPALIGYHILSGSEMSTAAVAKRDADERLGNIVTIDGRTRIIEYSDLPEDVAKQQNLDGSLRFWAGNTAVHVFDVAFLDRCSRSDDALPFHTACKKVSCIDELGNRVESSEPNAIKFERFIFDLLPAAERAIVVEADAARTFAPVKNAPGEKRDSPDTCRAAMIALHREWLESAGAKVALGTPVEISPLFALDAAEARAKIEPGIVFDKPTYLR
ncbi:MAG: UTP--glucose-1-phosphate uridylyltransferase [Pirellulales bacterium]|nr:UTP--glucose-1-phosphate uridylyltransferase [Pirellulales bacterium]